MNPNTPTEPSALVRLNVRELRSLLAALTTDVESAHAELKDARLLLSGRALTQQAYDHELHGPRELFVALRSAEFKLHSTLIVAEAGAKQ